MRTISDSKFSPCKQQVSLWCRDNSRRIAECRTISLALQVSTLFIVFCSQVALCKDTVPNYPWVTDQAKNETETKSTDAEAEDNRESSKSGSDESKKTESSPETAASKEATTSTPASANKDSQQNGMYKSGEGLFSVAFSKEPIRERAQLAKLGKSAVVLASEQNGIKFKVAFVEASDKKTDLAQLQNDFASVASAGAEGTEYKVADLVFKGLAAKQFEFVTLDHGKATETKGLVFKSGVKGYMISASGQADKMMSPAVLEFLDSFALSGGEAVETASKFAWSTKSRALPNLAKAVAPKHVGGYLPHFDYVPEFPYPVKIIKTGSDDTVKMRKSKTVTFTTTLEPMQIKAFYQHYLQENYWSTDVPNNRPETYGLLTLQPPPSTTKDGRMIIRIGPTGGSDYELHCQFHQMAGGGSLVDMEYIDHDYHGRPTTAANAQKYFMPNIKAK